VGGVSDSSLTPSNGSSRERANFRGVLEAIGLVVAPTTLLTAVALYFGVKLTASRADYFGIDQSTLGFSTRDYLLRSTDAVFVPVGDTERERRAAGRRYTQSRAGADDPLGNPADAGAVIRPPQRLAMTQEAAEAELREILEDEPDWKRCCASCRSSSTGGTCRRTSRLARHRELAASPKHLK
jgi:hypothetical protein